MSKTAGNGAAQAAKKKKAKKPLRRAKNWGGSVKPLIGRLIIVLIAATVLGVLLSALQGLGNMAIRYVITGVIVASLLALYFAEGLREGVADAASSRFYEKVEAKGQALTREEDASCYNLLKPVCAACLIFALPMALAVIVALCAKDYTYTLQDLPAWVTQSYANRSDVMGPLGAYTQTAGLGAVDVMRMIVRLIEMVFISIFPDPLKMGAMIDRLSPLMILTFPIAYVLGYAFGPVSHEKSRKQERRAKKIAVRKAQKSNLAEELVGSGGEVHYGQQARDEKKKKKELI